MEVACNVIKKLESIKVNDTTKTIQDLKRLNLLNQLQNNGYEKTKYRFNSKEYERVANSFMNTFFKNTKKDLGKALLTAYLITGYEDQMFQLTEAPFEKKLSFAASKTVVMIERILKTKNVDEEFYGTFDHFYSLLTLWSMKDNIETVSNLYKELKLKINLRTHNTEDLKKVLKNMLNINVNLTFKAVLEDYRTIYKNRELCKYFWSQLRTFLDDHRENLYVILISEIRVKLIKTIKNCSDRKDIYYNIDTDKLIEKIRDNDFNPQLITDYFNLIYQKMKTLNQEFNLVLNNPPNTWNQLFERDLITNFRKIYDEHERISSLL